MPRHRKSQRPVTKNAAETAAVTEDIRPVSLTEISPTDNIIA